MTNPKRVSVCGMVDDGNAHIGVRVTQSRERQGWNQGELATRLEAAGLPWHQTTVSKVERGERPVRAVELPLLAAVLGVDPLALLPGGRLGGMLDRLDYALNTARVDAGSAALDYVRTSTVRDAVAMLATLASNPAASYAVSSDPYVFAELLTRDVESELRAAGRRGPWPEVLTLVDGQVADRAARMADELRAGGGLSVPERYGELLQDLVGMAHGFAPMAEEQMNAGVALLALAEAFPDAYPSVEFEAEVSYPPDSIRSRAVAMIQADERVPHGKVVRVTAVL